MPFDFAVKHGAYLNTFLAKKRSLQSTIYLPIPCVVAFWFWFLTCVTTNSFFYRLIFFTSRTNGELKGYLELKAFFNYAKETMGIEKLCKKPDKDKPTFWLFIRMIFFLCRQNINKKLSWWAGMVLLWIAAFHRRLLFPSFCPWVIICSVQQSNDIFIPFCLSALWLKVSAPLHSRHPGQVVKPDQSLYDKIHWITFFTIQFK